MFSKIQDVTPKARGLLVKIPMKNRPGDILPGLHNDVEPLARIELAHKD